MDVPFKKSFDFVRDSKSQLSQGRGPPTDACLEDFSRGSHPLWRLFLATKNASNRRGGRKD